MYIAKRIPFLLLSLLNLNSFTDISDVIQSCYFFSFYIQKKLIYTSFFMWTIQIKFLYRYSIWIFFPFPFLPHLLLNSLLGEFISRTIQNSSSCCLQWHFLLLTSEHILLDLPMSSVYSILLNHFPSSVIFVSLTYKYCNAPEFSPWTSASALNL